MKKTISWLSGNRLINILLAMAFFLAVVTFHDEVTVLAIRLRRAFSVSGYNLFFSLATLSGFTLWLWWIIRLSLRSGEMSMVWLFLLPTMLFIAAFFFFMQTYAIEAVHFFQYAILALLLFPLVRSYGATVFWTTLMGMIDEINQYVILTPNFDYFDFNDILLNLLGAGIAVVTIYLATGYAPERKALRRALTATMVMIGLIALAYFLAENAGLVQWYPGGSAEAPKWFAINRTPPELTFWTKAYAGKYFHILKPAEGIVLGLLLMAWYVVLDLAAQRKIQNA